MKEKRFMNQQRHKRIILSGGGTGGHIFPAISVANALRKLDPEVEILFVGAEGKMEMELVPSAGYRIVSLPVAGLSRKNPLKNISVFAKLFKSLRLAKNILKDFKPDVVVGTGGYASGPILRQSEKMGIPVLIQEQNSTAGVTNRLLAKNASMICVAWDDMDKYFPADRIIKTGNPVRHNFEDLGKIRTEALNYFSLTDDSPIILILGGSQGAGSINRSFSDNISKIKGSEFQWIWQTGKLYYDDIDKLIGDSGAENVRYFPFIDRMDLAYAASDIIISRAGAGTLSELCLAGKPAIIIPSPNVAEDHQTKNALALAEKNAAVVVKDNETAEKLVGEVFRIGNDKKLREELSSNIKKMAEQNADIRIAGEVLKLAGR
jgi:UDP-N-acetylglucosamine--N-acetylmuramyl-(pentapeptide) pyrophosphoryl-undecaprenol N-acetylglucosamine transferase